jgi:FkbH-like protein
MFCSSLLATMGDALAAQTGARRVAMFVVRSVTVEPILPALAVEAALAGYVLDVQLGGYGSYADELLNPQSGLGRAKPDLVAVVLDLEDVAGRLPDTCADGLGKDVEAETEACADRLGQMLRGFRAMNSARLLVQGFVVPDRSSLGDVGDANLMGSLPFAVKRLNERLAGLCGRISDCVFFDVDQLAARYGRAAWQDTRMFLASRLQVSAGAFSVYARGMVRSFSPLFRAPRKVLCTDLDNTLWSGVLGEDGPHGIGTGSAFPGNCFLAYQQYLKRLAARGILLAAVSKNNLQDVEEAFAVRAADLAIGLDDFVAKKISWAEKTDSLRELAKELSLGLDSFVFVDDNPVECEAVRRMLPEVAVVEAPVSEPWRLVGMLEAEPFFDAAVVTADDLNRSQEYRAQAQRAALSESTANRDEMLASLEIVCTFVPAVEAPLARAVQLLAKTNQFNLTTRRHTADEVERFALRPGGQAIAVRVRDRFGDAGVVGLALAQTEGAVCRIDSLLLSCRVIGRGIESALLAYVAEEAVRAGACRLEGEYIATRKNAPCSDFYPQHGFTEDAARKDAESGSVFYMLDLIASMPESPAWLSLEGKSNEYIAGSVLAS